MECWMLEQTLRLRKCVCLKKPKSACQSALKNSEKCAKKLKKCAKKVFFLHYNMDFQFQNPVICTKLLNFYPERQ